MLESRNLVSQRVAVAIVFVVYGRDIPVGKATTAAIKRLALEQSPTQGCRMHMEQDRTSSRVGAAP